jgi:hypothetical protein
VGRFSVQKVDKTRKIEDANSLVFIINILFLFSIFHENYSDNSTVDSTTGKENGQSYGNRDYNFRSYQTIIETSKRSVTIRLLSIHLVAPSTCAFHKTNKRSVHRIHSKNVFRICNSCGNNLHFVQYPFGSQDKLVHGP